MKTAGIPLGCAFCSFNRRRFLAGAGAACAAAALPLRDTARAAETPAGKIRIRILYSLHAPKQPGPDWPNVGFDFQPVMEKFNKELGDKLPNFEFLPAMANGPEAAKKIIDQDKDIDGYLVYQMNCWNQVVQTIATSGKPVLYADFQYAGSGGFLVYTAGFLRNNAPNVGFVASSDMKDQIAAVRCFDVVRKGGSPADFVAATAQARVKSTPGSGRLACKSDSLAVLSPTECLARMKASRILAVRDQEAGDGGEFMGIPITRVAFAELNDAWANADKDEARAVADRWEKNAALVEGVSRETLETSAAMYLGQKAVLNKYGANAITINCLGGIYSKNMVEAYPCLGFMQLDDEGKVGACEADQRSTLTKLIMTHITGRPGFISDPVIDTAKNRIIYAHCVGPTKVYGPAGASNPYDIRSHSEDRKGACNRSLMPLGKMTTTMLFDHGKKQVILHQGVTVENVDDDKACRTKLAVEVKGDVYKLMNYWDQWGWHRVTVYGDLKRRVYDIAALLGFSVIEEA